jgi:sn-glycerol 3-phosphate transport system permease protein
MADRVVRGALAYKTAADLAVRRGARGRGVLWAFMFAPSIGICPTC